MGPRPEPCPWSHGVPLCFCRLAAFLLQPSCRGLRSASLGCSCLSWTEECEEKYRLFPWCSVLFRVCPRRPGKSHLGKPLRKPHYSSLVFKLVLCTPSQMLRTSHIHRTHMCVCFDYNAYVYVMSVCVCIIHSTINFQGEKPRSQTDCSPQPLEPSCSQCHTSGTSY